MSKMREPEKILILCREYDKFEGREPIIYDTCTPQDEITNGLIKYLSIRQRMNPELAYYFVLESHWKAHEEHIKQKILNEHKYDDFDDFIGNGRSVLESNGILRIK